MRSNMIWTTRSLQMKMTLGFSYFFFFAFAPPQHESFMNTHAHVEASSFSRASLIPLPRLFSGLWPLCVSSHSGLPKRPPAAGDGRTDRDAALCVRSLSWWLNEIYTLRVDLLERGGAGAPGTQSDWGLLAEESADRRYSGDQCGISRSARLFWQVMKQTLCFIS